MKKSAKAPIQSIPGDLYSKYLDALLNGDRKFCEETVHRLLEGNTPIPDIYTNLFRKSLYEVGELWERNRITVAHEHLATAITEGLMNILYPKIFQVENKGKSVLVACVPGEFHQIGAKMVADFFEMNRWDSHFLGADTPVNDLLKFVQEKKPDIIALSLSIYFNLGNLKKLLTAIQENFLRQEIIIGGQAFRWGRTEFLKKYPGARFIGDIRELTTIY